MSPERRAGALSTVGGLAVAWIAFTLLVWAYGQSPRHMAALLFEGTWGTAYGVGQVIYKATPLLFTGVSITVALRAGLFNIGAEGQLTIASLAVAVAGASSFAGVSPALSAPMLIIVAAVAGAAYAAIPALLRAYFGAHEVISTIMMNRIADALVGLAMASGLALSGTVRTADIAPTARWARLDALPLFGGLKGSAANLALPFALAVVSFVLVALERTRAGREMRLVGQNPKACEAEHVPVRRRLVEAMLVSGALAGLASTATVLGYKGYYETGLGAGAGFTGIAVAILGRRHPMGLLLAALLFGTLEQGGLAINGYVPMEVMEILQGVVVVAVALADTRIRKALARIVPLRALREAKA